MKFAEKFLNEPEKSIYFNTLKLRHKLMFETGQENYDRLEILVEDNVVSKIFESLKYDCEMESKKKYA